MSGLNQYVEHAAREIVDHLLQREKLFPAATSIVDSMFRFRLL
jgi:hypothetical protein